MQVDVDSVDTRDEIYEGLFLLWVCDVLEESLRDGGTGGEGLVHGEFQAERFSIDIANVDTTFVREKDSVSFTLGGDTDVEFGVRGVREERFYDEVCEDAGCFLDLDHQSQKDVSTLLLDNKKRLNKRRKRVKVHGDRSMPLR